MKSTVLQEVKNNSTKAHFEIFERSSMTPYKYELAVLLSHITLVLLAILIGLGVYFWVTYG